MVTRYVRAQLMVLLCGGLVGPVFLAVYFALGAMARPALNWMFWIGLLVTAADVLVALALTNRGVRTAVEEVHGYGRSGRSALPVAERLRELDCLHTSGVVTDEEYAAKRRDILDQL